MIVGLLLVGGAAASAVVLAAAGSTTPPDVRPEAYSTVLTHVSDIALATANAQEALAAAQARPGVGDIGLATIVKPPPPHDPAGTWLHFVARAPATDERSLRAQWEADLITGVIADAIAHFHNASPVTGASVDIELPDGTLAKDAGGGMGLVASGQRFSEASDAEIKTAIQAALNRQNLKVVDLNVARVDQPAPNIVVETEDPQEAARSALSLISSLFFNQDHQPTYEGYYFEVVDATGSPVLIQAASFRTGAGHLWFRPDVANALSLPHL